MECVECVVCVTYDIWVVESCKESDTGRDHGIVGSKEKFEMEFAAFVGSAFRAVDDDLEVAQIVRVWNSREADDVCLLELVNLFFDSFHDSRHFDRSFLNSHTN